MVRHLDDGGLEAQCPVCAASGGDSRGQHLRVFPDGRFACVAHAGDALHRKQIWAIAGDKSEDRPWVRPLSSSRPPPRNQACLEEIESLRDRILDKPWTIEAIEAASPVRVSSSWSDQVAAVLRLFEPGDVVWIGGLGDSGQAWHARHFRAVREWLRDDRPGPRISTCTFKPGSISRSQASVLRRRFLVVESDELGHASQGAVIRWLIEGGLRLRAVVDTRGRSLHAWFDLPGKRSLEQLAIQLPALGMDSSLFNPVQPVRLPGWRRSDSGLVPRLLYLSPAP